ncbi:MAG: hypothetical protein ACKOSS_07605 [Planctomycetia bacterium]
MSPRARLAAACVLLAALVALGVVIWLRLGAPAREPVGGGVGTSLAAGGGREAPALQPGAGPRRGPGAREAPGAATPAAGVPEAAEQALLALLAGGSEGEAVQAAAAALRARLRGDPAALAAALARLLDPALSSVQRQALALVLGTLERPGVDAALLAALERYKADGPFARCALLALGATREPDDDDEVFGLGDRPWGQQGPAGLGITVERRIEDGELLAQLAPWLRTAGMEVREAAAVALRHSLDDQATRWAFLSALLEEPDDEVALPLGEGLVVWLRTAPAGDEGLVAAVLSRTVVPGFDGLRLRLEDDLEAVPFSPVVQDILAGLCATSQQGEVRRFAHTVLVRHAAYRGDAAEQAAVRARLLELVRSESDAALRDLGASLLRRLPATAEAVAALRAALPG